MPFEPVQLPSGRWQGGFRHPVTRRKVTRTFDYSYEAEAWAAVAEQRARDLEPADPAGPATTAAVAPAPSTTIDDYGHRYLARRHGTLSAATIHWYSAQLRGLRHRVHPDRAPLADRDMATLKRAEVEQWMTDCVAGGIGRPTINGRLKALRTLYRDAIAAGELGIGRDPTHGLKYLTVDVRVDHVIDAGSEESVLLLAAPEQLRAAMLAGLDAGLRWQEVYALTGANVVGEYLIITQVIERTGKIRRYPKGHRARVVPMTERLQAALEPYVAAAPAGGLLFPALGRTDRDDPIDYTRSWDYHNHRNRHWLPTLAKVNASFGFHTLRHTYGSRLAAAGVPRAEIATLMGHADEATTARYIHAGDDGRRRDLVRSALALKKQGRRAG